MPKENIAAELKALLASFPSYIPFPMIHRPHRPGESTLAAVRSVEDLPSRLIFGDLLSDSFKHEPDGWSVEYRDGYGNGLDLSVAGKQFTAKPKFLGTEGLSVGPTANPRAFQQLLNLAGDVWNTVLQKDLQERFPMRVFQSEETQPCVMYIPDGWLKTILVPIHPGNLDRLLEWHMSLADDLRLGAAVMGGVSFQFNAVNYVEGRCPSEFEDANMLFIRTLETCGTPIVSEVVREQGNDGTAAWTVRRYAYLYRCNAFLRDVPYLVESLSAAGLLPTAPDLSAAVAPAESAVTAKELAWFSPNRECRITWIADPLEPERIVEDSGAEFDTSLGLVKEAIIASEKHDAIFIQDH